MDSSTLTIAKKTRSVSLSDVVQERTYLSRLPQELREILEHYCAFNCINLYVSEYNLTSIVFELEYNDHCWTAECTVASLGGFLSKPIPTVIYFDPTPTRLKIFTSPLDNAIQLSSVESCIFWTKLTSLYLDYGTGNLQAKY